MKQRRTSNQSSSTRAPRFITRNLRLLLGVLLLPLYTAHAESFRFALLGDVPGISTDKGSAAMLAGRINKQPMAFSIFLGNPRAGAARCDDAVYQMTRVWLDGFEKPVVPVPDERAWSDCRQTARGAYNPAERLAAQRRMFHSPSPAAINDHMGMRALGGYPETRRWRHGAHLFVTLHLAQTVSFSNTHLGSFATAEVRQATQLTIENLSWLRAAAAETNVNKLAALWVALVPDPRFEDDRSGIKNRAGSGYAALRFDLAYILTETRHRDMSVVVMHAGPSHKLIVDQPLVRRNPQYPTANLHRIQVPGGRPAGWLRVIVEQDVPLKFRVEEAQ